MNDVSSLGSGTLESAQNGANLQKGITLKHLKQNFAALATSVLALTSAEAGPLTLENMPDAPVTYSSLGVPSATPGIFSLDRIDLRVAGDESAEIFSTTGSLVFRPDGSIEMILNAIENDVSTPSFMTRFDRYEEAVPGISLYYNGGTMIGSFDGGPGYDWINFGNYEETGVRFAPYSQASNVPEPGSLPLVVGGLVGAAGLARRKRNAGEKEEAIA